ncbi:MAG: hypothetical protein K2Q09_09390, partial [Phycisphaerales bacterium]|nr:hypothetical protein [Phycisphaerales bacterium]
MVVATVSGPPEAAGAAKGQSPALVMIDTGFFGGLAAVPRGRYGGGGPLQAWSRDGAPPVNIALGERSVTATINRRPWNEKQPALSGFDLFLGAKAIGALGGVSIDFAAGAAHFGTPAVPPDLSERLVVRFDLLGRAN